MKSEKTYCIVAFIILAVVVGGYMTWYGQKTLEASLQVDEQLGIVK